MTQIIETPGKLGMNAKRLERIRPVMQSYIDKHGFAGISIIISRRGKMVYADQLGWQDKEAGVPMQDNTIFRLYSMTKPIICTALMLLYEEGLFQLTDPVSRYISAFANSRILGPDGRLADVQPLRPMQIRDLMTHTSGLTYDFLEDYPICQMYRDARLMNDSTRRLEDLVDELARLPLAFQPGDRWHYSLGIDVAAQLIQAISGQPLGEFLRERLFTPLGMEDTAFDVPADKRSRLAAMYGVPDLFEQGMTFSTLFRNFIEGNNQRREVEDTYPVDRPDIFQRGGIGLFSTTSDYHSFAQMLHSGLSADGRRILSRKTLELMHSNHLPPALLPFESSGAIFSGYGYGLGSRVCMNVAATAVPGSVGEFGWSGAAKTYYWVDPQEELVGVFMSQYMVGFDLPESDLRVLVYQAIDD